MRYRLLGRLEVAPVGNVVPLGPPRQRVLLASLLLQPDHIVSVDWLVDALWRGQPPRTARTKVEWYIYRLRKVLDPANEYSASRHDVLVTHPAGYELVIRPGERDLDDFERLASDGRRL